jgi:F420-dependent oxidoreductase-like protein
MQVALSLGTFDVPGGPTQIAPVVGRIAEDADRVGISQLWVMDHFFQIPLNGKPESEMLEDYSLLAYLAARTERIELGVGVTGVPYRHPGVLIKTVTTLDVLSGGRAWFGIGAAWNNMEAQSLGIPFPPMAERFERLEEALQIAHQMWAGDESPFEGRHYRLQRPLNSPNSLRRPHPPILIGGSGERKTLRLVAQYAEACNLLPSGSPLDMTHKLDVLRRHCEELGRPYEEITKTGLLTISVADAGAREAAVAQLREMAAIGFDTIMVGLKEIHEPGAIDALGGVADAVRHVVPAGRETAVVAA